MSKHNRIFSSVFLNWVAMTTGMVVAFFLSPYVVHHLGNVVFGVWTIVVSASAYMSLLDLGLRGAVTRYVAGEAARGDHLQASRTVSAALTLRIGIAGLIIFSSVVFATLLPHMFRISPEIQNAARWAMILTGISLALTLTFGIFSAVLVSQHRFDITSSVTMAQSIVRACGVVYLLHQGHSILALAIWELCVTAVSQFTLSRLCFVAYPHLKVLLEIPRREIIYKLWSYSVYAFIINICQQVIYYTDNLVVGAFLSMTAVTFYAVGGGLVEYMRQVVAALSTTFVPLASRFEAEGKHTQMQSLLINGTRASLGVALPISIALFFRGHTFIALWMGQQYAPVSGRVLQILLVSTLLNCGNSVSGNIVYGLGKHRPVAFWAIFEAVANLSLSVILVRRLGPYGVAWGTMLPSVVVSIMFWPSYISRVLGISQWYYLWQSWGRSALVAFPFGVACYYTDLFWHPANLVHFFLQIAAVLPVFVLSAALVFWGEITYQLRVRRKPLADKASVSES